MVEGWGYNKYIDEQFGESEELAAAGVHRVAEDLLQIQALLRTPQSSTEDLPKIQRGQIETQRHQGQLPASHRTVHLLAGFEALGFADWQESVQQPREGKDAGAWVLRGADEEDHELLLHQEGREPSLGQGREEVEEAADYQRMQRSGFVQSRKCL